MQEVLRSGEPVTLTGVTARFGELPSGGWQTPPSEAMVLPLIGGTGEAAGAIVLAASAGRALDESYRSFLGLVAQQTAALVNGAVAYQAQLRRAEELAELDRAKTTFFSNVSHEFRTPLTLIMGPVEELRARLDPADAAAAGELDVIYRNGLRLGKLVNTLLDFSRIEAGRMQASFEPLDLGAFTTELASVFESAVERARMRYEVDCPPLSAPVYVDREMWEKVVFNLLSNALKFTFDGTVSVRLREEDGHAVLHVADTGVGIAAAEIPRLFDRFHRIENVPSRSNEGSGIGLALVWELVGLHGGTVTVDSAERAGTTFTVRIPFGHGHLPDENVAASGGSHAVSAAATPFLLEAMGWLPADPEVVETAPGALGAGVVRRDADGKPGPARVLLADDNTDMREYLERLLRPGYQVTTVTDGQAALEAARADPPDIVISDVMMPRLGGLQLVAALRADLRTAEVPVLLLSARAGHEAAIEGLEAGADDYLVKPFSAAELLARVRANVELARLRGHHARWRTALLDSLHEAFFLREEDGSVVEINSAFTDILGYGADGLPYPVPHPWWPDEQADPEGYQMLWDGLERMRNDPNGSFTVPLSRRDGQRIWVTGSFNEVRDPENGRRMLVGTLRDVTAEHYAVQREAALAAMGLVVSRAGSAVQVLHEALEELHRLWRARQVTAVTWTGADQVTVTSTGAAQTWDALPAGLRDAFSALREQPVLMPTASTPGGAGVRLEHPAGTLGIWIDLGSGRMLGAEDRTLLSLVGGYIGQALHRAYAGRSAARDGADPAARDPRPVPAARRVRGPVRACHPPARGRRRLVRHRRAAGRADRHHGRRLRRARSGRGHGHGPAAQRLPRAAAAGRQRGSGPDGHGPVRVAGAGGRVRHCVLRRPRSGDRGAHLLQCRASAGDRGACRWRCGAARRRAVAAAGGGPGCPAGRVGVCAAAALDAAAVHRRAGRAAGRADHRGHRGRGPGDAGDQRGLAGGPGRAGHDAAGARRGVRGRRGPGGLSPSRPAGRVVLRRVGAARLGAGQAPGLAAQL